MENKTISDWLKSLGSKTPTPGGGAVAGLNGAIAAAQLMMICGYTEAGLSGRPETLNQEINTFLDLSQRDSKAFLQIQSAYKSGKNDEIQTALIRAAEPSMSMVSACEELFHFCKVNFALFNNNMLADLIVVLANLRACVHSAQAMLIVNTKPMSEGADKVNILQNIKISESLISAIDDLADQIKGKI